MDELALLVAQVKVAEVLVLLDTEIARDEDPLLLFVKEGGRRNRVQVATVRNHDIACAA